MLVKYVEANEKKYPVSVNFAALMETQEVTGKGLQDFKNFTLKDYLVLFHHALIEGASEKGEAYKSDMEHSKKLLNHCYSEFIGMLPDFFEQLLPPEAKSKKDKKLQVEKG